MSEEPIGTLPAPRSISAPIRRRIARSASPLARPHPLAIPTPSLTRPPPAFTPLGLLFTRPSPPALFYPPVVAPRPNGFLSCLVAPPKGKEPQSTRKTLQVDRGSKCNILPPDDRSVVRGKKKKEKKQNARRKFNFTSRLRYW